MREMRLQWLHMQQQKLVLNTVTFENDIVRQ